VRPNPGRADTVAALEQHGQHVRVFTDSLLVGEVVRPQAATAEKGEYLFATYTAGVIELLEDVIAWDGKSWKMA